MIDLNTIRAGLAQGEFFLEYLPTVSLSDGRCIGAEALIRWRRATGVVPPADFIPLAENTPLSGLITYWVIDTVAAEMGDWLRANPEAHISINVPPEILGRGGIEYSANKSGLLKLASQFILEITERGVPDLLGIKAINNDWGSGVRIALDDVSHVGGANLALLARCNFHIIKLDRSLVSQINPQCPSPEWLAGIAAVLLSSRLEVIAEGMETEQQLIALRAAKIQAAQGFYFSRPLPAATLIAYHREAAIHGRSRLST
jgi:sensor c-di-GMP phosphodiesterase-like protein